MFKRQPSSVQILLELAEQEIRSMQAGNPSGLNGNYSALRKRLLDLGIVITEGQSPEEIYQEAAQHFKKSQSFYASGENFVAVAKVEALSTRLE